MQHWQRCTKRAALDAKARADLDKQVWMAAYKGDVAAIERLAAEGASPDAKSEHGEPAVYTAALRGYAGPVSAPVSYTHLTLPTIYSV